MGRWLRRLCLDDLPQLLNSPGCDDARLRLLLPTHYALLDGGIGTLARGLLPAIRDAAGDDEVRTPAPPASATRSGALARIGSRAGGLARVRYEQLTLPRLARSADLMHLCDARPVLGARTPFVATIHDVSYLDHPEWFTPMAARYKRAMLAALLRKRPRALVFHSAHGRDRLLAHHPEAQALGLHVIPPGLTTPARRAGGTAARSRSATPYFLTVSTIEPRKNHLGLLAAFHRARAQGLPLSWKVAGPPGHRGAGIVAALESQPGVDVLGLVSLERLEQLYADAAFLAAPSLDEGFGYPPLEAMARGVPVLCSTGSALDETTGGAAEQIPALDQEGWVASLLMLARDSGRREELARAGAAHAGAYRWPVAASRLWDLYRSCA